MRFRAWGGKHRTQLKEQGILRVVWTKHIERIGKQSDKWIK